MREEALKQFFQGNISALALAEDLAGSTKRLGPRASAIEVEDMASDFEINRQMLVRVCDAVLAHQIPPGNLHEIGFALTASDRFLWDEDDLLANVISDWSCPEVNYPLTMDNVQKFRQWLLEEEPYPPKPPLSRHAKWTLDAADPAVVSVTTKTSRRRWWQRLFHSR